MQTGMHQNKAEEMQIFFLKSVLTGPWVSGA